MDQEDKTKIGSHRITGPLVAKALLLIGITPMILVVIIPEPNILTTPMPSLLIRVLISFIELWFLISLPFIWIGGYLLSKSFEEMPRSGWKMNRWSVYPLALLLTLFWSIILMMKVLVI